MTAKSKPPLKQPAKLMPAKCLMDPKVTLIWTHRLRRAAIRFHRGDDGYQDDKNALYFLGFKYNLIQRDVEELLSGEITRVLQEYLEKDDPGGTDSLDYPEVSS